jgi:RNA polymerase I-specific transcription initiation factor RRN7
MRVRLPSHFHAALEIRATLKPSAIQGAVLELVEFYNFHFGMVFPSLNAPLLIFRHVRDLGLPSMFLCSTRLACVVDEIS